MGEEEKNPVQEVKKAAAEEKKGEAAEEGKKGEEAPPPPQEIVLRVFMHCEGCARKVRRCLKGFPGVEEVMTDCKTGKVIVKGEKADPVKVFERVQRKSHRQVELISPVPKPPPQEPPKPPEKEEPQDKKQEAPVITVVLGVYMHCDACAQEIKRRILRMTGVESAEPDLKISHVAVKGVVDPIALANYVYKRTGKHAAIIKVDPEKKDEEKAKEEKKAEEGEKEAQKRKEEEAKDGGSGGGEQQPAKPDEDPKTEVKRNELYYYYPQNQQLYHPRFVQELNAYPPQMFSDENPNACSVM